MGHEFRIASKNQKIPRELEFFRDKDVVDFSIGHHHMGAVCKNGEVYTWGEITNGKLGHSLELLNPELNLRNTIARSGNEDNIVKTPKKIENIPKCKKILCKYKNTFILTETGEVYVLGSTERGVNGTGRKRENIEIPELIEDLKGKEIEEIAGGNNFCMVLDNQGRVYSWGLNNNGQLGDSESYIKNRPSLISSL